MKPIWMFIHNCVVHPAMGIIEVVTWGRYLPKWLENLHDRTAEYAGF